MKVYVAIVEDRHCDIDVQPFDSREKAISYAKQEALSLCRHPEDFEEDVVEGCLYWVKYSCEGDCAYVVERDIK